MEDFRSKSSGRFDFRLAEVWCAEVWLGLAVWGELRLAEVCLGVVSGRVRQAGV
jgi:hypothetical protein